MSRLRRWAARRTAASPVALARIGVTLAALLELAHSGPALALVLAPGSFRAPFVAVLPTLPAALLPLFATLWAVLAIAFGLGVAPRLTATGLAPLLGYVLLLDRQLYSNHLYLMVLLVLLLALAEGGGGRRRARPAFDPLRRRAPSISAWPVDLLRAQLAAVYLFSALSKLNEPFLSGRVLASVLEGGGLLALPAAAARLAPAIVGVELFLAVALWVPPLRRSAIAAGVALHLGIVLTMPEPLPLAVFGLEMLALYPLTAAPPGRS